MARLKNPRITKKEQNLIKGGIRRIFSRSELRRRILDKSLVKDYQDPNRKRVTRWGKCADCGRVEAAYKLEIDHISPIIRPGEVLDGLTWDEVVDRLWCDEDKLQALCDECHSRKTQVENKERRRIKKEGK